jgi:hypothetical protein
VTSIGSSFSKDKELGELKRQLQDALKKIPTFDLKDIDGAYVEPMYLAVKSKPRGVLLLQCMDARVQEDPQHSLGGGFVHWTWDGVKSRVRINQIDGFTPDANTLFRMTFMVVG